MADEMADTDSSLHLNGRLVPQSKLILCVFLLLTVMNRPRPRL